MDEIPNSVITEAINNAIAHRNYASNGSIQVEIYQNRIEVISPGRLTPPLTIAMLYGKHESIAPNPHIARAMFWVKYIETVGTGLNDLLDACSEAGLKRPAIEANDLHFRLTIWRRDRSLADKSQINTDKPQINAADEVIKEAINEVIFEAIKRNPGINKPRLISKIGKSRATIERGIAILVDAARIEHRGSKKTGGYYALPTPKGPRA